MAFHIIVSESGCRFQRVKRFIYRTSIVAERFSPKSRRVFTEKLCHGVVGKAKVSVAIYLTSTASKFAGERDQSFFPVFPTLNKQLKMLQSGQLVSIQRAI
jgi:hypothetical protein